MNARSEAYRRRVIVAAARSIREVRREPEDLLAHVSVSALARTTGLSRSGIRNHFPTKAALIDAVLEHLFSDTSASDGRAFADLVAAVVADPPTLSELVRSFTDRELDRFRPDPGGFSPGDAYVLWLLFLTHVLHREEARKLLGADYVESFRLLATNVYEPVLRALGRRARPPLRTVDVVSMVSAQLEGNAIRQLSNPDEVRRTIEIDGESWTLAAFAIHAIIEAATEPIVST